MLLSEQDRQDSVLDQMEGLHRVAAEMPGHPEERAPENREPDIGAERQLTSRQSPQGHQQSGHNRSGSEPQKNRRPRRILQPARDRPGEGDRRQDQHCPQSDPEPRQAFVFFRTRVQHRLNLSV
jgi:hypothetical protein